MNTASLSLDQAPPIAVPLRFFLTAPLFGVAAGVLLLLSGPELLSSRWSPAALAVTHLLTLGVLGLVMCGAMMQLLPVVAGSPVSAVRWVSGGVHLLVTAGTVLLCAAFLTGASSLFGWAGVTLGAGFILFITVVVIALARVGQVTPTVVGMRLAVTALSITLILGLILLANFSGTLGLTQPRLVTDIHLGWGLLGWVGWLVMGVAYQVVPMFQMTPEYPRWITRWLLPGLFAALLAWTVLLLVEGSHATGSTAAVAAQLLPAMGYGLFAIVTLSLQQRRKRRLPDGTLLFWRVGMLLALVGLLVWAAMAVVPGLRQHPQTPLLLAIILLPGAALSLLSGMLYKIVPFLCWFHLQHRKIMTHPSSSRVKVPNMKEFMPDRLVRRQLAVQLVSLSLLLAALWGPRWLAPPAGLVFAVSMGLLWWHLAQAMWRYRRVSRELGAGAASDQASR